MTLDEYLRRVEEATGQSREQLRARGIWPREGACRLIECPGWHLTTDGYEARTAAVDVSQSVACLGVTP